MSVRPLIFAIPVFLIFARLAEFLAVDASANQRRSRGAGTGSRPADLNDYAWTEVNPSAPWAPRAGLESVALNGRFYVMGGRTPLPPPAPPFASIIQRDVWASDDRGASWEYLGEAPWPERAFFESVTMDGYIYVMGGQSFDLVCPFPGCTPDQQIPVSQFYNDVYRSSDGIDWELMTDSAAWAPRAGLSAVVRRGWIYVFGGAQGDDEAIGGTGREFFTDVHKSRDGRTWIEVTDEVPWRGRGGAATVVKDGWLYLLGGEEGFLLPPFGDVWRSRSGADWELVNEEAWLPRSGHKCGVLTQSIVCFGGFNLFGNPMDVQVSRDGIYWAPLDPSGPASPPWMAETPDDIKYDFDIVVDESGMPKQRTIHTFGGDRETFEFLPLPMVGSPPQPPGDVEPDLRVDNDVWRFSLPTE
jgi:hypothetical protein